MGESIMLCINSNLYQEWWFILVYNGKCRESLKETRRLIVEEVDHTPNAKISVIFSSASKTFLVKHMFNECNNGEVELLKGE
jgi:hypothetical protein